MPSWPLDLEKIKPKVDFSGIVLWISVWIGIFVHIAIGSAKKQQEGKLPPIIPINYITKLINAKYGDILIKETLSLIGFFGVVYAFPGSANPLNAFLVGYSLDSFVELFRSTIEQKASKLIKAEKESVAKEK